MTDFARAADLRLWLYQEHLDEAEGVLSSFKLDPNGDMLEMVELAACWGRFSRFDLTLPEAAVTHARLSEAMQQVNKMKLVEAMTTNISTKVWREDQDRLESIVLASVSIYEDESSRLLYELDSWRLALVAARARVFVGGLPPRELEQLEEQMQALADEIRDNPTTFQHLWQQARTELDLMPEDIEITKPEIAETRDIWLVIASY